MRLSNTSTSNDKAATDEKVKLIIGEIGRDTKTGIIGRGYSFDNGKTFHVTDTIYGRVFDENDADAAWNNGMHDKVKDKINQEIDNTVTPAIKQADEAVKTANDAIEKSKVNENSIREMNNAVSDAISDAAVAKSDGMRAWEAAQSNVDLIDSNYASASAAISDVRTEAIAAADEAKKSATAAQADIKAVRSDVAAVQADVTATKSDVAVAKSDIAVAKTDLASQATSLSSYASQAAAAGKDITALKSQAGQFEQDMADTKGDVSQLKVSAKSASVALSDAAGDINKLQADAKGTAQTLTDAKGDISTLQATATGFKNTLTDAQGNISTLQSDVSGLKKTTSDHAGNIATLQADAKTLASQMSSAQGDISTLKQTASGFSSKVSGMETSLADANSKINDITSNGGGRNLLTGTQDWQGDWICNSAWKTEDETYEGLTVRSRSIAWGGIRQPYDAEPNTTYAFSFYAKASESSNNMVIFILDSDDWSSPVVSRPDYVGQAVTTKWQRYSVTFTTKSSGKIYPNACSAIDGLTIYVAGYKLEKGVVAHDWSPAPEDVDAKITTNATAIEQNKKAIALKADQTTVDKTNGTVQQLQSQLQVQADQIASKVSSSDLDAKGYATQTYTQTQIKQTADAWNANLTSVSNDLTKSYTNLHATVDGIQAQVYNSDGSSKITQLSNLIATKVSQGDYNSQITQLQNDINLRVSKGDVISQINQEAGGNTLIQVSNGKGSLILDAGNTIVTGKAWIPSAAIANLTADDIKTGTLTGSTVHLDDGNGNTIDLGDLATDYVGFHSKATNGDQTYIDCNGIHNYGASYDTKISQGKITTNLLAVNGGGLIDFRSSGDGTTIDSQNIKFYNSNAVNGGIEFSGGSPLATAQDGAVGNELRVRYDRSFALTPIKNESARICASSAAMQVGFVQAGSSTPDRQTTGLWVDNDRRHVNLGVWGADSTWARVEANTHNIRMQADKAHAWLSSDNVFRIYKDGDSSSTAIKLQVDGWAWVNGWVEAAGHSQHSALSTKTDIQPVDDDKMLKMVNDTDLTTFLYKTDVANGDTHRHIGLIIDDVHDVAQYQTPQDFIAPNGVSRDDDNMIGALFGAVKALTKRIKTLESKVG